VGGRREALRGQLELRARRGALGRLIEMAMGESADGPMPWRREGGNRSRLVTRGYYSYFHRREGLGDDELPAGPIDPVIAESLSESVKETSEWALERAIEIGAHCINPVLGHAVVMAFASAYSFAAAFFRCCSYNDRPSANAEAQTGVWPRIRAVRLSAPPDDRRTGSRSKDTTIPPPATIGAQRDLRSLLDRACYSSRPTDRRSSQGSPSAL
jgi:hypothetical protein